jgi:hypothetical protein
MRHADRAAAALHGREPRGNGAVVPSPGRPAAYPSHFEVGAMTGTLD